MKKAYALIILFALLPFSIRAQHHAAQSVSDMLSGITPTLK